MARFASINSEGPAESGQQSRQGRRGWRRLRRNPGEERWTLVTELALRPFAIRWDFFSVQTKSPCRTSFLPCNSEGDGIFVWRDISESVTAVAVDGAAKLTIGFADAVGGAGGKWFSVKNCLGFALLEQPWFSVWAAETTAVSWEAERFSAGSGLTFQKLRDRLEGPIVLQVPGACIGNDRAIAGSGKQDDAKRCGASGAFLDEVAIGRNTNFMLRSPVCTASMPSDHWYHDAAFSQLPPWLA